METKDYWTIGISLFALSVSIGAVVVAILSYRISRRTEARTLDALRPFVDPPPPACDGIATWLMPVDIQNRDSVPVVIERFALAADSDVALAPAGDFNALDMPAITSSPEEWFVTVNRELAAGEKCTLTVGLGPKGGNRVPSNGRLTFVTIYRRRDVSCASIRLQTARVLNTM